MDSFRRLSGVPLLAIEHEAGIDELILLEIGGKGKTYIEAKFITIKGKKYGPYLYRRQKVNGTLTSTYIGKGPSAAMTGALTGSPSKGAPPPKGRAISSAKGAKGGPAITAPFEEHAAYIQKRFGPRIQKIRDDVKKALPDNADTTNYVLRRFLQGDAPEHYLKLMGEAKTARGAAYNQINKDVSALEKQMRPFVERALYVKKTSQSPEKLLSQVRRVDEPFRADAASMLSDLDRITGGLDLKGSHLAIRASNGKSGYYATDYSNPKVGQKKSDIYISSSLQPETVFGSSRKSIIGHELGHHLEEAYSPRQSQATALRANVNYQKQHGTKIADNYARVNYAHGNGTVYSTELLSSGIEHLLVNPTRFYIMDQDHFEHTVKQLRSFK